VLVAGELPEDSQFPIIDRDLLEAPKYTLLWATKDAKRIHDSKIFWVFMKMNLRMGINTKPQFSPSIYNSLQSFAEFKEEIQKIYIRARKDPTK